MLHTNISGIPEEQFGSTRGAKSTEDLATHSRRFNVCDCQLQCQESHHGASQVGHVATVLYSTVVVLAETRHAKTAMHLFHLQNHSDSCSGMCMYCYAFLLAFVELDAMISVYACI